MKNLTGNQRPQIFVTEGSVVGKSDLKLVKRGSNALFYQTISLRLHNGSTLNGLTMYDEIYFRNTPDIGDKARVVLKVQMQPDWSLKKEIVGYKRLGVRG